MTKLEIVCLAVEKSNCLGLENLMKALKVLEFPDKKLRIKSKPVEKFDDELKQFVERMFVTMYEEDGIGLAAPQTNNHIRLITVDTRPIRETDRKLCLINPEIVHKEGKTEWDEGCLSVPGVNAMVKRAEKVKISYQDITGESQELEADGIEAICIQHEIDHLDGVLFIDHLSRLKRNMVLHKIKKMKQKG